MARISIQSTSASDLYGSGFILATRIRIWIRFMKRIRVAKNQPKSWKISTKSTKITRISYIFFCKNIIQFFLQKYHTFFFAKISNFCLFDRNIYLINNITRYFSEKYIFDGKKSKNKKWYFLDFRSNQEQEPDPDPGQNETDLKHCVTAVNKHTSHVALAEEEPASLLQPFVPQLVPQDSDPRQRRQSKNDPLTDNV